MTAYMQEHSRNLVEILRYAARVHSDVEVVSRAVEDGSIRRSSYAALYQRTCQLANALAGLGLGFQDRVGTLVYLVTPNVTFSESPKAISKTRFRRHSGPTSRNRNEADDL